MAFYLSQSLITSVLVKQLPVTKYTIASSVIPWPKQKASAGVGVDHTRKLAENRLKK